MIQNSEIMIETQGLTKFFAAKPAVDHLDLRIARGQIVGLLGRNGSGKTTAIKMMLGFLHPTAGRSTLLGCDSRDLTPAIRERVGYVTEGHHLFRWMRIGELERFQRPFFPGRWDGKLFDDMIEYFRLSKKQKIKHLSNGQRAQVSLALALCPNPELLIMDDPTLGLDVAIRRQFLEGIIHLIQRQNRTILFSSHILSDVERVADRIVVLDRGVLRADCAMDEFRRAIRKVRARFPGPAPENTQITGLLHQRRRENELELILVGADDAQIEQWAQSARALQYRTIPMTLEDQFIEYTETQTNRRLFAWEDEK